MKIIFTTAILLATQFAYKAQHTFSIIGADTITGEIGGAGATCYAVVNDIADVHPGVGYIHTQSYVDYTNQAYAHNLMANGVLPQQIMDSLVAHDASGQPQLRQYAAVMFSNGPHTAAYSGSSCFTYYGSRLGRNYAIAGNILLGPQVLDSMEVRFKNTPGSLSQKLMAALQGAKIIGADKRCINNGVSSLSAYMIVAKPTDISPNYYLNLNVENVLPMDPIDSLQNLYNAWNTVSGIKNNKNNSNSLIIYPNPAKADLVKIKSDILMNEIEIYDSKGLLYKSLILHDFETKLEIADLPEGVYVLNVKCAGGYKLMKKLVK